MPATCADEQVPTRSAAFHESGRDPAPAPAGGPHSWVRATWPWLLLFALSLPAVTTRIYASDEVHYFVFLRSAWFDHDLSFDNDYRYFYEHGIATSQGFYATNLELTTETNRRVNFGTVGCALLWAPFYAVADAGVRLGIHGPPSSPPGFSRPYIAAVCYGSAFYGFAALLLSAFAARRLLGQQTPGRRRWAVIAPVAVLAGTPLAFYAYIAPVFAHACSAFAVALFVVTWLWARDRWTAVGFLALGAGAALMTMVREQDVFFVVGPAIDFALTVLKRDRARLKLLLNACLGAIAFAVAWLPQALAYVTLNGHLGPSRLVTRKMTWTSPHALQVLLSPEHGLLFWTPLVVIGLGGLIVLLARRDGTSGQGRVIGCMLAMIVMQVYVSGSVESWTVAGSFGQRRFVGLTILLVTGLSALFARITSRAARAAVGVGVALCVWWNVALAVQFGAGLMDRQRLTLATNAYNAFVVVPREIPRFIYRYVFDRKSFYAAPQGAQHE